MANSPGREGRGSRKKMKAESKRGRERERMKKMTVLSMVVLEGH